MTKSILFVCLGNICRSPTAEGIFRQLANQQCISEEMTVDSAGTIGYHQGEYADSRAISAAKNRGYDISKVISRKIKNSDFTRFDLLIAMDQDNYQNLSQQAVESGNEEHVNKIKLFLDYSEQDEYAEVPDPYYGGDRGFDLVIDLIEDASLGLIRMLKQE